MKNITMLQASKQPYRKQADDTHAWQMRNTMALLNNKEKVSAAELTHNWSKLPTLAQFRVKLGIDEPAQTPSEQLSTIPAKTQPLKMRQVLQMTG